jgi:hypothetical protein
MGRIGPRLWIVGRGSLLLAPLLLGGCFYSPSTSIASSQPNMAPPVVLYGQPDDAVPSTPGEAKAPSDKRLKASKARAKAASQEPDSAEGWAAEDQANVVDDAALRKKLVICDGCQSKPTPKQKRETVEQTDSSEMMGQQFR